MELGQLKSDSLIIKAERDQYKWERDEANEEVISLVEELESCKESGKMYMFAYRDMTKERDSFIEEVEKLREELRAHVQCNDELGRVNKLKEQEIKELKFGNDALRLQADKYFNLWQEAIKK